MPKTHRRVSEGNAIQIFTILKRAKKVGSFRRFSQFADHLIVRYQEGKPVAICGLKQDGGHARMICLWLDQNEGKAEFSDFLEVLLLKAYAFGWPYIFIESASQKIIKLLKENGFKGEKTTLKGKQVRLKKAVVFTHRRR